ncbi:MAG TPA: MarR family winged helix-turn-helix transcriptional regulator [Candidatus Paceibacterota bacterium]|nr:MarR family winged helix-turn-helix transcriptional regulator [Candidatus Paceibacterota bacterium]
MITEKDLENTILGFHRKLISELHKEAERLHFTPSQLQVLQFVSENENPTMKDIAAALNITPPSVTSIVEPLCDNGFLKREVDENDRRIVRVVVAPKTFKAFSSLKDAKLVILKNLFSKLNNEDKESLSKILNKIINE